MSKTINPQFTPPVERHPLPPCAFEWCERKASWVKYAGPWNTIEEAREWRDLQDNRKHLRVGRTVFELEVLE